MTISDETRKAGKQLWPMTEGELWQLEIIQRACNETARPLLEAVTLATNELRTLNEIKAAQTSDAKRLPELDNYLENKTNG